MVEFVFVCFSNSGENAINPLPPTNCFEDKQGVFEREQGWRSGLGSILDAITHVDSACRFSALIPEVSLRVLRFSPFNKNQYLILFVATEFDLFRTKI